MISGIGIDLVEVRRMDALITRWATRFIAKVFTNEERSYCDGRANRAASYAARFAAKEAFAKALGTGWDQDFSWKDFSVRTEPNGRPRPSLSSRMKTRLGDKKIHLSLSHTDEYATAVVVIEVV